MEDNMETDADSPSRQREQRRASILPRCLPIRVSSSPMPSRGIASPPLPGPNFQEASSVPGLQGPPMPGHQGLMPKPLRISPHTPSSTFVRDSDLANTILQSSTPAQAPRFVDSVPGTPTRASETGLQHVKQAIIDNATFLFPGFEVRNLKIAMGFDKTTMQFYAFIFVVEVTLAEPTSPAVLRRGRKVLLQARGRGLSRQRALEGLLRETEIAVDDDIRNNSLSLKRPRTEDE